MHICDDNEYKLILPILADWYLLVNEQGNLLHNAEDTNIGPINNKYINMVTVTVKLIYTYFHYHA